MKITVLSENISKRAGVGAEHGLSLYIEALGKRILFDFGASSLFAKNAVKLGVDLSLVDFAVLSHGHSDHGGGISAFLEINSHAPIYVHPCAFEPHYNAKGEYIGLDPNLKGEKRLIFVDKELNIDTGLRIFNCNHLQSVFAPPPTGHTKEVCGVRLTDDYAHEQYLEILENGKRVLISGCSHKGIVNISEWVKPTHIIGGFHFSKLPIDAHLQSIGQRLSSYPISYYSCHCTGQEQFKFLRLHMDKLFSVCCGDDFSI